MADNTSESALAASGPPKNAAAPSQPLAYTVKELMAVAPLGRSTIFACLADGRLQRVKIGRKTLIPRASVEALLSGDVA